MAPCTESLGGEQPPPSLSRFPSHCELGMSQPSYKYVKFIELVLDNQ